MSKIWQIYVINLAFACCLLLAWQFNHTIKAHLHGFKINTKHIFYIQHTTNIQQFSLFSNTLVDNHKWSQSVRKCTNKQLIKKIIAILISFPKNVKLLLFKVGSQSGVWFLYGVISQCNMAATVIRPVTKTSSCYGKQVDEMCVKNFLSKNKAV